MVDCARWDCGFINFGRATFFRVGQQTLLNHLKRSSRDMTWIHLGFLFAVTLVPLTTRLLDFDTYRTAILYLVMLN
jgi:uncharacterized membrane protein